jgi:protein-ribulosamine 3-kinase
MAGLPQIIADHLQKLEPNAQFTGTLGSIKSSNGNLYFAKVGSPRDSDQYTGEAQSLQAIYSAAPGLCPRLLASGSSDGKPYFLSEYKDLASLSDKSAEILGKRLATELHAYKSTQGFGFAVPTYCGATRQDNGWFNTWEECYSEMIGSLLDKLNRKGSFGDLCSKGEEVRQK